MRLEHPLIESSNFIAVVQKFMPTFGGTVIFANNLWHVRQYKPGGQILQLTLQTA